MLCEAANIELLFSEPIAWLEEAGHITQLSFSVPCVALGEAGLLEVASYAMKTWGVILPHSWPADSV